MTSDALETGLKFDVFFGVSLGIPNPESELVGGNWAIHGRTVNSQIASSTIQDTEYNINHAGIKGYEKTRMQNERNRGHWIQDGGNPSQPGGPSKEGPADDGKRFSSDGRFIFGTEFFFL